MKQLLFLLLLFTSAAYGQTVSFKEIKIRPNQELFKTNDSTIIFPIVISKKKLVSKRINNVLRKTIMDEYAVNKTLKQNLYAFVNDIRVTDLSYEITLNKKILSMNIYMQGCGAYCSSSNTYFNFDLNTGKKLEITDIIAENKLDSFTQIVKADKTKFLLDYKEEEKYQVKDGIDSSTYDLIVEHVDSNCMNTVRLEQFSLSYDSIEIIDACEFPHFIRSEEPHYKLKYSYNQISRFIKPDIKLH